MQNETAQSTVTLNGAQAKQEMTALTQKANNLRMMLKEANEAGDGKAFEKYNKQLKETTKQMNQMAKEAFDVKKVLDNLSGASIKDLEKAQKQLNATLRSGDIARNSEEWRKLQSQLKSVKSEISDINSENKVAQGGFSRLAEGANKYLGIFAAGLAAVTGITLALKNFMDQRLKLEDSQANLKSLTGLGDNDITWLTEQAALLSTTMTSSGVRIRASSQEIVDAFTIVGSAKPELLKDRDGLKEVTEQALILAEASKMQVGDAVKGITIALNMYGASAKEAARYTNVLGAGAKEGAAEVSSQTESILKAGVAASQANIPIEQLVGSIQTLAEKGIKDEIAGTGLKTFFIKLQSGADDTNPKIVGLQKALENLAAKQLSSSEIQKQFGLETYTVASAMIASAEKVKFYTDAVTGTTTALEQAQINSLTKAASLAQAKNRFNELGMELVKNLNPAMLGAANLGNSFLKVLVQMPKWLNDNKGLLFSLAGVMILYSIAVSRATIQAYLWLALEEAKVLWTKASTAATLAQVAVTGYLTGGIRAANLATKEFFLTLGLNPIVAIGIALAAVTIGLYKWISASQSVNQVQKSHADIQKKVEEQYTEQEAKIKSLVTVLNSELFSLEERRKALGELKKLVPNYHADLTNEGKLINNNKSAIDQYLISLEKEIRLQASKDELIALYKKKREQEKAVADKNNSADNSEKAANTTIIGENPLAALSRGLLAIQSRGFAKAAQNELEITNATIKTIESEYALLSKQTTKAVIPKDPVGDPGKGNIETALDKLEKWKATQENILKDKKLANEDGIDTEERYNLKMTNLQIDYLTRKRNLYAVDSLEYKQAQGLLKDIGIKRQDESKKLREKEDKEALESFKKLHEAELIIETTTDLLKRNKLEKDLEDGIISQSEYDDEILKQDVATAYARLKIANDYSEDAKNYHYATEEDLGSTINAANNAALDADKAYRTAKKKLTKDGLEEVREIESRNGINASKSKSDQYKEDIKVLKDKLATELADTKKSAKDKKDAIERFTKDITVLNKKNAQDKAQDIIDIASKAGDFSSKLQEAESLSIENKYAAQLKAAKGNADETKAIEEQMEADKVAVKKKYADIDFALTSAKIIASTALAVMKAWEVGPIAGPILAIATGATGLAELAVANEQRTAIQNLWTGGFTDDGGKYEPRGIVHAGEFVANQEAVRNTPMRKVFNLVDYAQRTNRVAQISSEDIVRSLGIRNGYANGGFVASVPTPGGNPEGGVSKEDLAMMYGVIAQNSNLIQALHAQIQNGIKADVSIAGKNGVAEQTTLYNKLLSNAQRG